MYEAEFQEIWQRHRELGHAEFLTNATPSLARWVHSDYPIKPRPWPRRSRRSQAFGLHGLIFFQRRMYGPRSAIGLCELE